MDIKKVMCLIVSLYGILIILYSCNNVNKNASYNENFKSDSSGNYVLIIKGYVDNLKYIFPSGLTVRYDGCDIQYIGKNLIESEICLNPEKKTDTIIIQTDFKYLNLKFKYRGLDEIDFLIMGGDTVEFTFTDNFPIARVLNNDNEYLELNFEQFYRQKAGISKFSSLALFKSDYINKMLPRLKKEAPQLFLKRRIDYVDVDSLRENSIKESKIYYRLLDSLRNNDLVSDLYYDFYYKKMLFEYYDTIQIDNFNKKLLKEYVSYFNDSLSQYQFYHDFLNDFLDYFAVYNNMTINKSIMASVLDDPKLFDTINISNKFPHITKEILLKKILTQIIEHSSVDDIQLYLQKYIDATGDSSYYTFVVEKHNLDFGSTNKIYLKTTNEKKVTFSQIIEENKGKVVYVDFWASWCAPCIRAMPASHKLRQEFNTKNVVFIYISLDENMEKWINSCEKFNLTNVPNNYIVENLHSSRELERLNIEGIPRYIIYNKQGLLVHKNAPGPSSDEIKELINKYTKDD